MGREIRKHCQKRSRGSKKLENIVNNTENEQKNYKSL